MEEVKELFQASFIKLYQSEQIFCPMDHPWCSNWCASLDDMQANTLVHTPLDEEIWGALKSMKPYKAPGVDGLHEGFF